MDEKCRLCLLQLADQKTNASIVEEQFSVKLKTLFTFPITSIESFPTSVCIQCEEKVIDFHTYHELVKNNQDQLWAIQHQKYLEQVKVETATELEYDVLELRYEEAEPAKEAVYVNANCKEEKNESKSHAEQNLDSEPDENERDVFEEYIPPNSPPSTKSDDSECEEHKPLKDQMTAPRLGQKRRGRPRKGDEMERSTGQKKSCTAKRQQPTKCHDEQNLDSDPDDDERDVFEEYIPPTNPSTASDDSEYEENKPLKDGRTRTDRKTAARLGQTRRGRPRKGEQLQRSTTGQKKSCTAKSRQQPTDETSKRLQEFYDMKCELCEEKLESFTALKNHYYRQHQVQGYIKCCGRTFNSRYRLLEHLSYHVGASMVRCEICNKSFSSRSYLLVHKSRMHGQEEDRPYKCTQCPQSYAMECHLKAHAVSHVRVKCTICDKELSSSMSLRTHMINMHGNRESHICDSCGREFRSRQAFDRHVKLHLGLEVTEQVQCKECLKWLNSKRALKVHVQLVHTEAGQTFHCDICKQQYPNSRALAAHKQRVHVEERFKCEECGKLFKRQLYLKEHVAALHTRKPLYSCEVCGATFNSNANKYSHRKNKHPVEWEARRKQQLQQQQEQQQHQQRQEEQELKVNAQY